MSRAESSQCLSPEREQGARTGCIQRQRDPALSQYHWVQETIHTGVKRGFPPGTWGPARRMNVNPDVLQCQLHTDGSWDVTVPPENPRETPTWRGHFLLNVLLQLWGSPRKYVNNNHIVPGSVLNELWVLSHFYFISWVKRQTVEIVWGQNLTRAQARKSQTALLKSLPQTQIYYFQIFIRSVRCGGNGGGERQGGRGVLRPQSVPRVLRTTFGSEFSPPTMGSGSWTQVIWFV